MAVVLERIQRGLGHTVQLLLLDEYDSALDCRGRHLAHAAISHIRQRTPCATMCITHVPLHQPQPSVTAIVMRRGRIVCRGLYSDVWNRLVANEPEPEHEADLDDGKKDK